MLLTSTISSIGVYSMEATPSHHYSTKGIMLMHRQLLAERERRDDDERTHVSSYTPEMHHPHYSDNIQSNKYTRRKQRILPPHQTRGNGGTGGGLETIESFEEMVVLFSDWWVRLGEFGIDNDYHIPKTRRAHSSTVYVMETATVDRELVVSNVTDVNVTVIASNFTNEDVPISETTEEEKGDKGDSNDDDIEKEEAESDDGTTTDDTTDAYNTDLHEYMIISGGFTDEDWKTFPVWAYDMTKSILNKDGPWTDITPVWNGGSSGFDLTKCDSETGENQDHIDDAEYNLWEDAMPCAPQSRLGHFTTVHNDHLYVFGGLLYNDQLGVFVMEEEPYIYRLDLKSKLSSNDSPRKNAYWERIVPRVKAPPPSMMFDSNDEEDSNPKYMVNRGEVRGGYWKQSDGRCKMVIYGGLHVKSYATSIRMEQQEDNTLGDIWAYDFATDTWEMIESGSTRAVPKSESGGSSVIEYRQHPGKRTSHAATVVRDELIIHGGLKKIDVTWEGTTTWDQHSDMWIYDLKNKVWRERVMMQELGRSYHSLVGWEKPITGGSIVACYGGYKTVNDPMTEEAVAYVYDETYISPPSINTTSVWMKASLPPNEFEFERVGSRLEHTAVLSTVYGVMFVWGGRLQTTNEVYGVWSLNLAGKDSRISFSIAEDDSTYGQSMAALYVLITTIMLMSMMFTYMCGVLTRQSEGDGEDFGNATGEPFNLDPNNGGSVFGRRNGLAQDIIDTLPTRIYTEKATPENSNSTRNKDADDQKQNDNNKESTSNETNDVGLDADDDDDNCCPICLVEYKEGDEMRCLPCGHEFHKTCVDSWLENNASCPSCRHSYQDLVSLTTGSSSSGGHFSFLSRSHPTSAEGTTPTDPDATGETTQTTRRRGMLSGAFSSVLSGRAEILRNGRRNRSQVSQVQMTEIVPQSPPEDPNSPGDDINDLELSYSSSLELTETVSSDGDNSRNTTMDEPNQNRTRGQRRQQRERRMRVSVSSITAQNRRVRGNRGRRRRVGSPLNVPLQPSDASIV